MSNSNIVDIKNLSIGYEELVLSNGIFLKVLEPELIVISGENGVGKSTLLETMYGLNKRGHQNIYYNNKALSYHLDNNRLNQIVSYLPQKGLVSPSLTVQENLLLTAKLFNQSKTSLDEIYTAYPTLVNILSKHAANISGGQAQLVSLAMVALRDVDIILLDEPMAGLSLENAELILENLITLKETGKAIIVVEHRLDLIDAVCDSLYSLDSDGLHQTK